MGTDGQTDRQTDDTETNTIARPLYLFFITIVIIKEGRAKKGMEREMEMKKLLMQMNTFKFEILPYT
jgi:hypothetical protein